MSCCSGICGTTTIGTPAATASIVLPIPPCVTNTALRSSTRSCGTWEASRTFGGAAGRSAAVRRRPWLSTTGRSPPPNASRQLAKNSLRSLNTVPSET
ncbi:hypothetical protein BJF78_07595 [Pseudonocardia sp. CNS-139]|nr:hypothetical protein BJF78_07595 [Pseudonocardia sp. CNS-139]